uniref:Uncharacterized LOC102304058 n=1 Tax=Haplochromis burtoni TaxID=8153 RepID=A0A3Q2W090_HAPBU
MSLHVVFFVLFICVHRKFIHDVKTSSDLGNKVIAGKVLAKSVLRTYETKKKEKKFFFYLGVADETGSIKVVVYGREHYQLFQEKSCYLFRNVILDENVMKVTTKSVISKTAAIDVPENLEMEAQRLGYSQTPVCSIEQAIGSAEKTSVSVQGKVRKIDTLKKKQGSANRKEFQLEDGTGSIRITLWGENIKQLRGKSPGDSVRVVNVETNHYNDSVSLNSTDFTRIFKERVVSKQKNKQKRQKHFVDEHRVELIQRVSNIEPILEELKEKIIQQEAYDKIRAQQTPQEKMRALYNGPLKAGDAAKEAFYQSLKKHEKILIEDLS